MGNFCTNCGTRLVNGVCPNCSAAQPAAQYQQPVPQYQQPAPQNQQPAPQYQQPAPQYQQPAPQAEQSVPLYQHIGNNMPKKKRKIDVLQEPSEKYLFVLGNKNFKKFMRRGKINKNKHAFAVVSDKRLYIKGRVYTARFEQSRFDTEYDNTAPVDIALDLKDISAEITTIGIKEALKEGLKYAWKYALRLLLIIAIAAVLYAIFEYNTGKIVFKDGKLSITNYSTGMTIMQLIIRGCLWCGASFACGMVLCLILGAISPRQFIWIEVGEQYGMLPLRWYKREERDNFMPALQRAIEERIRNDSELNVPAGQADLNVRQ